MMPDEWKKLKKIIQGYPGRVTNCPICGGEITEDDKCEDLTYSRTREGSHIFLHKLCVSPKGGKHAKQ